MEKLLIDYLLSTDESYANIKIVYSEIMGSVCRVKFTTTYYDLEVLYTYDIIVNIWEVMTFIYSKLQSNE